MECHLLPASTAQWKQIDLLTILCLRENFIWGDIFAPLNIGSWEPPGLPSAFSFGPTIGSNLLQASRIVLTVNELNRFEWFLIGQANSSLFCFHHVMVLFLVTDRLIHPIKPVGSHCGLTAGVEGKCPYTNW